jgi:xanthine dehydrogenase molybdopterin-binding subunit B
VGQLIALVAATSQTAAEAGAKLVAVTYEDVPDQAPILTLEQAIEAGAFYPDNGDAADSSSSNSSGGGTVPCLKVEAVRSTNTAAAAAAAGEPPLVQPSAEGCDGCSSSVNVSAMDSSSSGSAAASQPPPETVASLIASSPLRLNGRYSLPAQQHMYMETQTAVAEPGEGEGGGAVRVVSATQSLDAVQMAVAGVLGVAYHQVEVVARRLGGG